jgi:hypothetical protein
MALGRTAATAASVSGGAGASFARPSGQGGTRRILAILRGSIWERGDGFRLLEMSMVVDSGPCGPCARV